MHAKLQWKKLKKISLDKRPTQPEITPRKTTNLSGGHYQTQHTFNTS